ncbi:ribonuclease J [bacterium]|nr:ribonuclease J [bacterium]
MQKLDGFTVTSLGGVGEIGKNCAVIDVAGELFIIDCGLSFPDVTMFGVNIIIPDFTYIYRNQHRVKGLFLTHGHEDHIGAVPYLIEGLEDDLKIYGSRLTLGFLRNKLVEWNQLDRVEMIELIPREPVRTNDTSVTCYRVTHSIPDAMSLVLETPFGNIVHSGDYKIDLAPVDGKLTDAEGLSSVGDKGVKLLMCDITNVERPGRTKSESEVGPILSKIIQNAPGRVFATTFASNIHRIQQIMNACHERGRQVAIVGRSMIKNVVTAQSINYINVPAGLMVDIDDIGDRTPSEICVIITGSQGEPMAALTQISQDRHARISIQKSDTVVFSASPIPGNETAIYGVINDLFKLGANVIFGGEWGVHASGHGSTEDIAEYLSFIRPEYIMPHHGQYRHLRRFVRLAGDLGYSEERVILAEIGEQWSFDDQGYKMTDKTRAGVVYISGETSGEVGRRTIKERQELARDGTLYISTALSPDGRRRLSEVVVEHKGFVPESKDPELYAKIREVVSQGIAGNRLRSREYRLQLQNNIGQLASTTVYNILGVRPNIQVLVNYIDRDESVLEQEDE